MAVSHRATILRCFRIFSTTTSFPGNLRSRSIFLILLPTSRLPRSSTCTSSSSSSNLTSTSNTTRRPQQQQRQLLKWIFPITTSSSALTTTNPLILHPRTTLTFCNLLPFKKSIKTSTSHFTKDLSHHRSLQQQVYCNQTFEQLHLTNVITNRLKIFRKNHNPKMWHLISRSFYSIFEQLRVLKVLSCLS